MELPREKIIHLILSRELVRHDKRLHLKVGHRSPPHSANRCIWHISELTVGKQIGGTRFAGLQNHESAVISRRGLMNLCAHRWAVGSITPLRVLSVGRGIVAKQVLLTDSPSQTPARPA